MSLNNLLEDKNFRKNKVQKLLEQIQQKPNILPELISSFLKGPSAVTQKASWIINYCAEKDYQLISPYLPLMIEKLKESNISDAVKRNTIRLLQFIEVQEELEGEVMNICFDFLSSRKEAVAIKAFSLTVLARLCQKYPEVRNELKILVEDLLPLEKPAFAARARKVMKSIP